MKKSVFALGVCLAVAGLAFSQNEQPVQNSELIQGVLEAPRAADASELASGDLGQYPYNTSLAYRGVIMANLNSLTAGDEIAVDFGPTGLWVYDSGVWHQISGVNPDGMIDVSVGNASDDELLVDFGAAGVWRWDMIVGTGSYPGNWAQASGVDADGMFRVDDDNDGFSEAHVDFGALGVWRWEDTASWTQISGLNPYVGLRMDTGAPAWEEGLWAFPSVGLWRIWMSGTTPAYEQLTGTTTTADDHASANFDDSSTLDETVIDFGGLDFGGLGLYLLNGASWTQLSALAPNWVAPVKFGGGADYELLVDFNDAAAVGLWMWDYPGTWTKIMDEDPDPLAFCEPFDFDGTDGGDEEVAVALSGGGIRLYDYSAGTWGWIASNTTYHADFMVKGDYYGAGRDSTLAVAFDTGAPAGLWLYNGGTGSWVNISTALPDSHT